MINKNHFHRYSPRREKKAIKATHRVFPRVPILFARWRQWICEANKVAGIKEITVNNYKNVDIGDTPPNFNVHKDLYIYRVWRTDILRIQKKGEIEGGACNEGISLLPIYFSLFLYWTWWRRTYGIFEDHVIQIIVSGRRVSVKNSRVRKNIWIIFTLKFSYLQITFVN